jgi:hypothetical protein
MTNAERWVYIQAERAQGRSYADLGRELGIDKSRVIQLARLPHAPARDTTPLAVEPGSEYGHLTCLETAPAPPGKKGRHARFRCRCGNECVLPVYAVVRGNNTSCGCQSDWESCRDRTYDRACAVCQKPFKGGPNARICGTVECRRARWRSSYKIKAARRKKAEDGATGG